MQEAEVQAARSLVATNIAVLGSALNPSVGINVRSLQGVDRDVAPHRKALAVLGSVASVDLESRRLMFEAKHLEERVARERSFVRQVRLWQASSPVAGSRVQSHAVIRRDEPPIAARYLLYVFLPRTQAGDIAELVRTYQRVMVPEFGIHAADFWFCSHAIRTIAVSLVPRVGVGFALRRLMDWLHRHYT